jgi:hypothetical protein
LIEINGSDTDKMKKLLKYARRNLSPYIYFSDWDGRSAEMGLQIQEPIIDEEGGSTIRFLLLKRVGQIQFEEGNRINAPTRSEFERKVREQYMRIINHSHYALLPAIYDRVVRVPEVNLAMAPFRKILISLEEYGNISVDELQRELRLSTINRFSALLQELGFIEIKEGVISPGAKMKGLKAQSIDPPELYEKILSEVIQQRSKYLTEVSHLTMIIPYLRWSNAYYLPSYEAGRLVRMGKDYYINNYISYYRMPEKRIVFVNQIQRVLDAEILTREKDYFVGDEKIFDTYSKIADKEKILQPA